MNNKEKNFISAVIYVHNVEHKIEEFLKKVIEILETNFENSEIICVNDYSTDRSVHVIRNVSTIAKKTSISILNMSCFHGLELSMNAGVDLSIGDYVFEFDSIEMDYSPNEIINIYKDALQGYDVVSASPNKATDFSSKIFYTLFNKFSGMGDKMNTERFRILSRRVINRVNNMNKTIPYRKAIYLNCGLKTKNVIYEPENVISKGHTDKNEKKYRKSLAVDTLILFTDVGYRFSVIMTTFMMTIAILMAVYSLVVYITANPIEGWTTTILFLAVAFFGLFGILTVIIKYLQILVDLVFRRKHYIFDSIEKITN